MAASQKACRGWSGGKERSFVESLRDNCKHRWTIFLAWMERPGKQIGSIVRQTTRHRGGFMYRVRTRGGCAF